MKGKTDESSFDSRSRVWKASHIKQSSDGHAFRNAVFSVSLGTVSWDRLWVQVHFCHFIAVKR